MKTVRDQTFGAIDQRVRFVLVGVLNTAFGYGLYAVGLWIGLGYSVAALLALVLGIAFSFVTQGRLVFKAFNWSNLPKYLVFWISMWIVNVGLISVLLPVVRDNAYLAGFLSSLVLVGPSYLIQRYWIFSPERSRQARN